MIELIIWPRRTGKTTFIVDKYKTSEGTNILICPDIRANHIFVPEKHILSDLSYLNRKNIFIDEYFSTSLDFKKIIFNIADKKEILAISTPKIQYKLNDIEVCRGWWDLQMKRDKLCEVLLTQEEMCDKFTEELMYNLLVHPKTLIQSQVPDTSSLSKEQYEMDILGQIFK